MKNTMMMIVMLTMRLGFIFLAAIGLSPSFATGQNVSSNLDEVHAPRAPTLEILRSCDEIPLGMSWLTKSVEVVGDIICDAPRLLMVPEGHGIEYRADSNIVVRNIHFAVNPSSSLSFRAGGIISIERIEIAKEMPVISVAGDLFLQAGGWLPQEEGRTDDDAHGVMEVVYNGRVHSNQTPTYTTNSIVVSAPLEEEKKEAEGVTDKKESAGHLAKLIADSRAMWDKLGVESPFVSAEKSQPVPQNAHSGTPSRSNGNTVDSDGETTASDSIASRTAEDTAANGFDGVGGDREQSGSTKDDDDHNDHDDNRGGAGKGSAESQHEQSGSSSQKVEVKKMTVLKVGDVLRAGGVLSSVRGNAAVRTGLDGAVHFDRSLEMGPDDECSTILMRPMKRQMKRILRRRDELRGVTITTVAIEDDGLKPTASREKKNWFQGWLAKRRRQHDERKRARDERDAALIGQVDMAVDRRGRVEVVMDGRNVISRSGPRTIDFFNRFPFAKRRKDSGKYEVHVTEEGLDVRSEGRHVWGIRADDIKQKNKKKV